MSAPAVTAPDSTAIAWELYTIWAATLPQMDPDDFDHEAARVATEPASAGARFMRARIDAERDRRQAAGGGS